MAAIALFTLTSCSDDDNDSTNNNPDANLVLPKKMIVNAFGETTTVTYTYNGNRLMTATGTDGYLEQYTYNGDKIVERKITYDGILDQKDVYTYDGENLTKFEMHFFDDEGTEESVDRNVYVYNSNGTITVSMYSSYLGGDFTMYETGIATITNGNLVSYVTDNSEQIYTFDDKNAVTKNLASEYYMTLAFLEGGKNNILSYTSSTNGEEDYSSTSVFTYNSDNYPATESVSSDSELNESYQYYYE